MVRVLNQQTWDSARVKAALGTVSCAATMTMITTTITSTPGGWAHWRCAQAHGFTAAHQVAVVRIHAQESRPDAPERHPQLPVAHAQAVVIQGVYQWLRCDRRLAAARHPLWY